MNRIVTIIALLMAIVVMGSVVNSLSQSDWASTIRFSRDGGLRFAYFLFGSAFVSFALLRFTKLNPLSVAVVMTICLCAAANGLWPLIVIVAILGASRVLGELGVNLLCEGTRQSGTLYFLAGAGIVATTIGFVAHFPVNNGGVYTALLAIIFLLGRRYAAQAAAELVAQLRMPKNESDRSTRMMVLHSSLVALGLVYVVTAFMPELGHDALAMHLFIPRFIANQGLWTFDASTYVWALMPALGDWLYALAYVLAGESASRLVNVLFIFAITSLVVRIVLWCGGNRMAAMWGAIFFLAAPLTFMEGTSLFIESIWGAYVVAGCWLVLRSVVEDQPTQSNLLLGGMILGFAAAAKAVTFTVLPVLILVLLLRAKSWMRAASVRSVVIGIGLFIAIGCVPYATAFVLTGNPLFPFYNEIFQSPLYPVENFVDGRFPRGFAWDTLWKITVDSGKYLESFRGGAGFHWLVLIAPALIVLFATCHRRPIALLGLGILSIVVCFQAMAYLRYVFPATVLLTAGIAVAVGTIVVANGVVARVFELLLFLLLMLNLVFITNSSFYHDFPLGSVFQQQSQVEKRRMMHPTRAAVEMAGVINGITRPIAIFASPAGAGTGGDVLHPNWYNRKFMDQVQAAKSSNEIAAVLGDRTVDVFVLDSEYREVPGVVLRYLEEASTELARFGTVSVRKLRTEFRYSTELLTNPNFSADQAGWSFGEAKRRDGGILVSTLTPAHQAVPVAAGRTYRNSARAKCAAAPTKGRLQIRWLDETGKLLKVHISLFDCTPEPKEHSVEVESPAGATIAEVWATGHGEEPLLFLNSSLRK
jgi:hypothetical protein